MRLSTKGRYAVMAMADLAGNATNPQVPGEPRPVALADVVERRVLGRSKPCNDVNAMLNGETAAA